MIAAVAFFSFFLQCTAAFSSLPLLRVESPAVQRLAPRADKEPTLRILRPRSGDIVIAEDFKQTFDITWVNNTLDFNASISLRQGPPGLGDLPKVATINGMITSLVFPLSLHAGHSLEPMYMSSHDHITHSTALVMAIALCSTHSASYADTISFSKMLTAANSIHNQQRHLHLVRPLR